MLPMPTSPMHTAQLLGGQPVAAAKRATAAAPASSAACSSPAVSAGPASMLCEPRRTLACTTRMPLAAAAALPPHLLAPLALPLVLPFVQALAPAAPMADTSASTPTSTSSSDTPLAAHSTAQAAWPLATAANMAAVTERG